MDHPGTLESRMQANLHVRFGGGPSEKGSEAGLPRWWPTQPLKRAAVKFGVGRYLYRLESQWLDYDPQRKQIRGVPTLPASALPAPVEEKPVRTPAPTPRKPAAEPAPQQPAARTNGKMTKNTLPANGAELQRRLSDYDARLAKQGLCDPGDLVDHVLQAGVKAGYGSELTSWSGPAIALAVEETRQFETRLRQRSAEHKEVA